MSEGNHKRLLDIRQNPGNDSKCADCGAADPEWASYTLGVFLCFECCGVHRSLGTHLTRTKSIKVDNWDDEQVLMMKENGNEAAAQKYLVTVPACYRQPDASAPQVLREQWIRAKYERKEFQDIERQQYLKDSKTGYLMKRGRDDVKFLSRKFQLSSRENQLVYFTAEKAKTPKAKITLDNLNCVFVPSKIGNLNGMQITYEDKGGRTRHLFVYSDDGKDIVDWYMAIRNAKLTRLCIGFPHIPAADHAERLTRDFLMEGWLCKTGPNPKDAWRRRWFTLDRRRLYYFDEPMSAFDNGEIYLGHKSDDFAIHEGVPPGRADYGHAFTLRVPDRQYPLSAETVEEREQWIAAINEVISTPLSAQDAAQMHVWKNKRNS